MEDRAVSSARDGSPATTPAAPAAPAPLAVAASRHSPVEAVLARAGATLVEHDGALVASDFGSAAGELAICARAVGIADRADLAVLELCGHPGTVAHVVERVVGRPLLPGTAGRTGAAWWCSAGARVLVLGESGRRAGLLHELGAASRLASGVECRDVSAAHAAVSIVGPRARQLLRVIALSGEPPAAAGAYVDGELAGTPVLLLRESATMYLLVMASGDEPAEWQALLEAGRPLGVAYVGRGAVEHYAIRERTLGRHRPGPARLA